MKANDANNTEVDSRDKTSTALPSALENNQGESKVLDESNVRAQHMLASDREAHIIQKAIEVFSVHGFSVSTRELAKHIGVTQPLIYRYFGNKENLIEKVSQNVFFSRWNPKWEQSLLDESRSIEDRLVEYLDDYTNAILSNDWIRLFIFAALNDPTLNMRYINLLKEKIFIPLLHEIRRSQGLDAKPTDIDIELFWGFHASFFYMGVRRWIYRMELPKDIHAVIKVRVQHFLFGYYALIEHQTSE